MLSQKEIKMWKWFQFYDKNGFFPFEKKKITFSLTGSNFKVVTNRKI